MDKLHRRDVLRIAWLIASGLIGTNSAFAAWRDQKHYMDVFGHQMAYYEIGSGRPIIFLHGNPTSSYIWRKIIPYVQDQGRCIAPDLMGMGDSDKLLDSQYTYASHRRYLYELFRKLGVEQDIVFVLHDWGSAMGFYYAAYHPRAIRGIAYMEALLIPPWVKRRQHKPKGLRAKLLDPHNAYLILKDNLYIERFIHYYARYLSAQDIAEYRRPFLMSGKSRLAMLEFVRRGAFGSKEAFETIQAYSSWLERSTVPKLFICGDPGAILKTGKYVTKFALSFPSQTVVKVKGHHFLEEESPDAVGHALRKWLARLP